MPVLAADLILPTGKLPADWFGESDLDVWISGGEDTVPEEATEEQADTITTAYVYWRAHEAKATALIGAPDSVALDGMSATSSNGRYDRLMGLAARFEAEWASALAGATEEVETVAYPPLASRSTGINFVF